MVRTQHNAWLHMIATLAVIGLGVVVQLSRLEWCAIVLAVMAVWTAEAVNTSLEILTDLVSPDVQPLAGRAKDVAAGAVLIAACGAAIIGLVLFAPHVVKAVGL